MRYPGMHPDLGLRFSPEIHQHLIISDTPSESGGIHRGSGRRMTEQQTLKRRRRLGAQGKWAIFQEASVRDVKMDEVLRR